MLEFAVLFNELVKNNRGKRKDAFADPLDAPEWQGLSWALRLFDRLRGTGRGKTAWRPGTAGPRRNASSFGENRVECVAIR